MSVLSDLVIAPADAAAAICRSTDPMRELGAVDIKGIDTIKLALLHAQLTGEDLDSLLPGYDPIVSASDDDGPWVFVLPAPFVQRLATLDATERTAAGARWASAEEFALDGWAPSDVDAMLTTIWTAARDARTAGNELFLRMSL